MSFYAHTHPDYPDSKDAEKHWEPLERHLQEVAELAETFASAFGAGEWGRLAGLWHDLGKYLPDFQKRIRGEQIQVEHAGAGARLASETLSDAGTLAFAIAGHHAGLTNLQMRAEGEGSLSPLMDRMKRAETAWQQCCDIVRSHPPSLAIVPVSAPSLPLPPHIKMKPVNNAECIAHNLWVRMIFSALVDADSLATEGFCSPEAKAKRDVLTASYSSIAELRMNLDGRLDDLGKGKESPVNQQRRRILDWCRERSQKPRGFFTLCVPTGGGKTLASMSFALRHAEAHQAVKMRRVIVAVPYTSIIEQNSGVYADFLGAHNVIEHHSNLDDYKLKNEQDEKAIRRRFACENWDAPVVVTTNVQLFESLFTHKRSRARKLHNIAGSVIILDEAQCVPSAFLEVILLSLRELVQNYGCSVVICTATQPAWHLRHGFAFGVPTEELQPIIPLDAKLLEEEAFDRVKVEWPKPGVVTTYDELAERMAEEDCALAIVHLKKDAVKLASMLEELCPRARLFHLSTNMCPAHRKAALKEIRLAVEDHRANGTPCRVVSTQLIESGVDLDVPIVFRALAGFDSIAQAAGRCNREGKLAAGGRKGRVVVYNAETEPPDGLLRTAKEATKQLMRESPPGPDLRNGSDFSAFFEEVYKRTSQDRRNILREAQGWNFESVSRKFSLIDDGEQIPVIIPYCADAKERLRTFQQRLEHADVAVAAMRALQPYTVNVRPTEFQKLKGALIPLEEGSEAWVLDLAIHRNAYSLQYGLLLTDEALRSPPGDLMVTE
ncbi:CRISPR-associated helicase/endonuclease Cas3 [soil metagenome]